MKSKEILEKIDSEIRQAADFDPAHAVEALNHTNVYLFRYFPKLNMIILTERVCRDFHMEPVYHDLPESFSAKFIAEEDRSLFNRLYYDINAGTPYVSADVHGIDHIKHYHLTLTVTEWDEAHQPELCVGVVEDRTEEELTKEELNAILSSISCGVLQYRQSDNALLRVNRAALDILGYESAEELSADRENGIARNVLPEDRRHIHELAESLTYPGEVKTIEYRVRHKNSDQIRYCYGTVQIYDDIRGERIIQRSIMDITDRKLREDIQHTNNDLMQRLDTIMSGIAGGFEITLDDPDFTYVFLNESVAALQGYTSAELLSVCGGKVMENIYPEDRDAVRKSLKNITWGSNPYTIKYRLRHKNGNLIWVSETGKKIIDKDGTSVYYCLIQDITESEQRAEELNRLLTIQTQMMTSLSCGVIAYTLPEREMLIVNDEARRIFDHDENDPRPIINTVIDHLLPEDNTEIHNHITTLQNVGDLCAFKIHPLLRSGRRLTVKCSTKLQQFDDGKRFILTVLSDITEAEEKAAQLAEANLKQQEMLALVRRERQQYRDALVSGSEYAYRFDVTDGMVRSDFDYSVRGTLKENLGLSAPVRFDDMIQRWLDVMNPEFLTPSDQNPLTAADVMACYERGSKHIVTEYYNEPENKFFRRTILLSENEENGHIMAIAIINDITNIIREDTRKRNELAMMNRDLRNQIGISKAFSSFYYAAWELDLPSAQVKEISIPNWVAEIQRIFEGDYQTVIDMLINTFVKEESKDMLRAFTRIDDMAKRLENESLLICDFQGIHYPWSSICLIPYQRDEDGHVLKIIFAVREISNEKRIQLEAKQALEEAYEAANRANAAKTEFLSSISHDIRTPMNGIIGMTAIAGTHLDDKERVADCLAKISVSSKHLLGLINEVLDMNKIESGKLDLNAEEFSLCDLMDTLLVMSKPQIESKRHSLNVNILDIEHENVIGDSLRIQQVFINLLSNSVKYTPDGGIIEIRLCEKATNNPKIGCFEFTVEDNGIGMSKEFQEKLFEPFTRATDQRVAKIQGSGLGMPIARNIVRMMNGDIQVESELSKGTKFTVTLYLELQEADNAPSPEAFMHLPILVADDDKVSCESTCAILADLGMEGEWVLTGREAVEKTAVRHAEGNDYFAVILDWKMPEMDGLSTAKEIRRQIGDDIPIIILSAYDWSDIEQEARAAGVNAFLSKPLFKSRLTYLFRNLLGNEADVQSASITDDLAQRSYAGKRALLAEDNDLNAEIAEELLEMTGLTVEHAWNGKEALDMVTGHPKGYYDVIFMDIQMPVMNGYETASAIRSLPGAYEKGIPIIAMTANAFAEDVLAAKNAGMNEHIAKPLNIAQLAKSLDHWLE